MLLVINFYVSCNASVIGFMTVKQFYYYYYYY